MLGKNILFITAVWLAALFTPSHSAKASDADLDRDLILFGEYLPVVNSPPGPLPDAESGNRGGNHPPPASPVLHSGEKENAPSGAVVAELDDLVEFDTHTPMRDLVLGVGAASSGAFSPPDEEAGIATAFSANEPVDPPAAPGERPPLALDDLRDLVRNESVAALSGLDDDLVLLEPPASVLPATPPPLFAALSPLEPLPRFEPLEIPSPLAPMDFGAAREAFNRLETFCLEGDMEKAAAEYESLPPFGRDGELNKLRADSANLLVLHYGRLERLDDARAVFDRLPGDVAGNGAMTGRARAILNLATFYVRADRLDDAFAIFQEVVAIGPNPEYNADLFRLAARMIPYLDNAGETEKAVAVYGGMVKLACDPDTRALFRRNMPGLVRYLLGRPSVVQTTPEQERKLALMETIFASLRELDGDEEVRSLRRETAGAMLHFYQVTGKTPQARAMREYIDSLPAPRRTSR